MSFAAINLPYATDALASKGLSQEQVEYHYKKHHKTAASKLNARAGKKRSAVSYSVSDLVTAASGADHNDAGQLYNHDFYWLSMSPNGGGRPTGALLAAIESAFGSFDAFKEKFIETALAHFGSGWVWLVKNADTGAVVVESTHSAESAIKKSNIVPLVACDVWEHAYYIDYKSNREAYLEAWFDLVNWDFAEENFARAGNAKYSSSTTA